MVMHTKTGSAQYSRILSAYVAQQDLIDAHAAGGAMYLGDLPGNAFLNSRNSTNVAYTGTTMTATLALELVDPVDDSQLADLGTLDLATGGRIVVDHSTVAQVPKASRLKATPTFTNVDTYEDVEIYLDFFTTGATDESLD